MRNHVTMEVAVKPQNKMYNFHIGNDQAVEGGRRGS